jgi:hypothetical protein
VLSRSFEIVERRGSAPADCSLRRVADLVEASYLERERAGRRNRYVIHRDVEMRHRAQAGREIGELLMLLKLDSLDEPS